ncbi:MAG TPA: hypothetical protein VF548_15475 [Allosphingosinicella sp.]|jgi:hypothetical protein
MGIPAVLTLAAGLALAACDGPREQAGEKADNASGAVDGEDSMKSGPAETMGERQKRGPKAPTRPGKPEPKPSTSRPTPSALPPSRRPKPSNRKRTRRAADSQARGRARRGFAQIR